MTENALDLGYAAEQQRLELEQAPVRLEFDELVRIIGASQTPQELGFGFSIGDREIAFAKGDYLISAKLEGGEIRVAVKKPEGSDYEKAMMGAFGAIYRPTTTAAAAANQIGTLMARVVEDRFL